jgi:DnaJ homologue, subfamily C, member 28, conserved domain
MAGLAPSGTLGVMVERRPTLADWENWVERQIREGIERGEFDNLPGAGKPLPGLDGPRDEEWWVKAKLRREQLSYLPPALAVRKELEVALERIAEATSEDTVRRIVTEINERIVHVNSHTITGPPSTLMPLDAELVVRRWTVARCQTR